MADTTSNDQPPVAADSTEAPATSIIADISSAAAELNSTEEKPNATALPSISNLIAETTTDMAGANSKAAPGSGTATPNVQLDPEQAMMSLKVSLADLSAKAARLYAQRTYEEAAEQYSAAAEMQAEMNGDMSPENAEILFLYGRALFKVGQSKSDVLGGRAPQAQQKKAKKQKTNGVKKANGSAQKTEEGAAAVDEAAAEEIKTDGDVKEAEKAVEEKFVTAVAEQAGEKEEVSAAKKPFFQFEGDENFEELDEDEDAEQGEGEDEEDDDLGVAFEILDLARVLFNKKLASIDTAMGDAAEGEGKGKEVAKPEADSPESKHVKERLADTHDLLAEISLENERYPNAVTDFRQSLQLKKEMYPPESEIIAEAHYKLSLALEFSSITTSADDDAARNGDKVVDESLREEAATELEAAINSTKLKLQGKEVELATLHNPEDNEATRLQIAEVREILADMEQRLVELRKPPVDVNEALGGSLGDIFGSALGGAAGSANAAKLDEAKKNANDLTGLVRKKRKAEEKAPAQDGSGSEVKKVKTEEEAA